MTSADLPPWRSWTVGTRVMVRRTLTGESHRYTDILGEIVHSNETGLVLRTRTGDEIAVPGSEIAIGKPVPPPPARRRPR
ncbi:putative acetyltransferase [Sanguibacter sp. A247]|uniref:putative acetyltransferase n=1 Tax=unclassified Sanguibacter TaxID=2645534 RepID=UPI003FD8AF6A